MSRNNICRGYNLLAIFKTSHCPLLRPHHLAPRCSRDLRAREQKDPLAPRPIHARKDLLDRKPKIAGLPSTTAARVGEDAVNCCLLPCLLTTHRNQPSHPHPQLQQQHLQRFLQRRQPCRWCPRPPHLQLQLRQQLHHRQRPLRQYRGTRWA